DGSSARLALDRLRNAALLALLLLCFGPILHTAGESGEVDAPTQADDMWREDLVALRVPVFSGDVAPLGEPEVVGHASDLALPGTLLRRFLHFLADGRGG